MKYGAWLRRLLTVLVVLLAPALLGGCGSSGTSSMPGALPQEDTQAGGGAVAVPEEGGGDKAGDGDRLIIRSKTLRLQVDSTPDAVTKIRDLALARSGSITDMQVATDVDDWVYRYDKNGNQVGDGSALRGWVTVRVPTDSFEEFVADVSKIGTIKFQSESTEDVTQAHVDMSARLENLRAQEARLREFFDAAKDVKDMLAIEAELGRVRGEIESLDAQVKYLERQAAMATVTIELVENKPVVRSTSDDWGFGQAVTNGVQAAATMLNVLVAVVIATSPLWLAALILFFPIRALVRRRRARSAAPQVPPAPSEAGDPDEAS